MSTEHEQWDIVSSVGWTALFVAAARGVESHRPDHLVDDPWAARFVAAARPSSTIPVRPDEEWDAAVSGDETQRSEVHRIWSTLVTYLGVRSRFFDRALDAAVSRGVEQVVLLAAGLDARALRLPWSPPVTVFEVDQAAVMEFKEDVVRQHGGNVACDRRVVGADLREDWAAALRAAGFDASRPTAWLAEGLLFFLPAAAEKELMRTVDELSAPGSEMALEQGVDASRALSGQRGSVAMAAPFGVAFSELPSDEDRDQQASDRLAELGWDVTVRPSPDVARGYGRDSALLPDGRPFATGLVTAVKP